ncbi:MAG: hypothetical protein UT12_C0016G0005 [Candidatus Curtissbacteria bacterium GW2011_GWC2_38_9]|uniref:Glycosyltransferase 2-like domain-containing protein n=3 Tax=Candidatus Curtissiibacteriota TaxID=1752717 RepID=A0A1F5HU60_9BACT|nr:MAG: hypothetical protein UT12_C0016G0005 [Candidatus Curtissbacteria bacterium GW2011_GWC2_38_9]KKS04342.1 MAG: hypothetical protein UU56_C0007G0029 [Candidatus Curtissbacteria bacterium GW2011_GWA2_41_24]OGD89088.1 MAG: hypothetical protein A2Z54_03260 [Candidatus Curtissbacteria bacterium RIFCSPHIGHO2_02_39_8]OGE07610.1 MAG: hypothetical protein A2W70_02355 [Candidatus Curtissbacteria bacterium RIFCSPLOWO2_02_41_11]
MVQKYPSISVVIPCLNGRNTIGNLLKSIYSQQYQGKIEVIATDDGSTDGTSDYLRKSWPTVKLIKFAKTQGSAPALNAAAKKSTGNYILATNDDVTFDKNAFIALVDCYQSQQKVGITTGKMLDSKDQFAIPGFRINHYLGYHPYDLKDKNKIRQCDWAVGACLFIKKDLFKKINGFDEGFIFCGEEYDLAFRIRQFGLKVLYTPKAIFYHSFNRNLNPNKETLFAHYRGKIRYMFKNGRIDHLLIFLPLQLLAIPFLYIFQGKIINIYALYRAFIWNLINLPKTLNTKNRVYGIPTPKI